MYDRDLALEILSQIHRATQTVLGEAIQRMMSDVAKAL